jgi:hypothetical protein
MAAVGRVPGCCHSLCWGHAVLRRLGFRTFPDGRLFGFQNGECAPVPAPLGMPLAGGWNNIASTIWFAVLALTYNCQEIGSPIAESA